MEFNCEFNGGHIFTIVHFNVATIVCLRSFYRGRLPLLSQLLSFHNRPKGFARMMYELDYGEKPFFPPLLLESAPATSIIILSQMSLLWRSGLSLYVDLRNIASEGNEMKYTEGRRWNVRARNQVLIKLFGCA